MFVTCSCAILDPITGRFEYPMLATAFPTSRTGTAVIELRATGMPLGALPGITYEEKKTTVTTGHQILFHSDGISEAHNSEREMFDVPV